MHTVAILAPTVPDATPMQRSRAQRALLEQMMLVARGHAVDSAAVRCAAAMVASAIASDPLEYELVAPDVALVCPPERASAPAGDEVRHREPAWKRGEAYGRYLRTIMSARPA